MTDYEDVLKRIKNIYSSSSIENQKILKKILEEIYENGDSKTYQDIWLADYKEIPVDKKTFLTDDRFLGQTNNNGKSIYPAWMDVMEELERTKNQYYEIVFTGATRTGKSSTAVSDAVYNLYKLMCLRNPQEYFSLKSVTTISIFFFNLNSVLAKGVCFKEFNSTISMSPWFLERGKFSRSDQNPVYIPEGGLIQIMSGSSASHALGMATYCLVGNTEILTKSGPKYLKDIQRYDNIAQYELSGEIKYYPAVVIKTKEVTETIRITLEDGSIIEGTPEHKIMLEDGTYKCLKDLTESDDIKTF